MRSYDALIHEMSELIDIPLSLGERGQVIIEVDGLLTVHIEHLVPSDEVRLAALLVTLPPDTVRERVLASALRANSLPAVQDGIFAFSSKRSALVIYKHYPVEPLDGDRLCDLLEKFILKGKEWVQALESGRTEPTNFYQQPGDRPGGLFGLH